MIDWKELQLPVELRNQVDQLVRDLYFSHKLSENEAQHYFGQRYFRTPEGQALHTAVMAQIQDPGHDEDITANLTQWPELEQRRKVLLDRGINGNTAYSDAISLPYKQKAYKGIQAFQQLLTAYGPLDQTFKQEILIKPYFRGYTLFHKAAAQGNVLFFKSLVELYKQANGGSLDDTFKKHILLHSTDEGYTLFHLASQSRSPEFVPYLIELYLAVNPNGLDDSFRQGILLATTKQHCSLFYDKHVLESIDLFQYFVDLYRSSNGGRVDDNFATTVLLTETDDGSNLFDKTIRSNNLSLLKLLVALYQEAIANPQQDLKSVQLDQRFRDHVLLKPLGNGLTVYSSAITNAVHDSEFIKVFGYLVNLYRIHYGQRPESAALFRNSVLLKPSDNGRNIFFESYKLGLDHFKEMVQLYRNTNHQKLDDAFREQVLEHCDNAGYSLFQIAVLNKNPDYLDYLIELYRETQPQVPLGSAFKKNVLLRRTQRGDTLYSTAVHHKNWALFRRLVDLYKSANQESLDQDFANQILILPDERGFTLFHTLCKDNNYPFFVYLVELYVQAKQIASVDASFAQNILLSASQGGYTPFHQAASQHNHFLFNELIKLARLTLITSDQLAYSVLTPNTHGYTLFHDLSSWYLKSPDDRPLVMLSLRELLTLITQEHIIDALAQGLPDTKKLAFHPVDKCQPIWELLKQTYGPDIAKKIQERVNLLNQTSMAMTPPRLSRSSTSTMANTPPPTPSRTSDANIATAITSKLAASA